MVDFHQIFLEKVRPVIDYPASNSDKQFILDSFMNRSEKRLTLNGLTWVQKAKIFDKPLSIKINLFKQVSPAELVKILHKNQHLFFLNQTRFVTFDQDVKALLVLMDYDFEIFLERKS